MIRFLLSFCIFSFMSFAAFSQTDIANGKIATASSTETASLVAANAVDGNVSTRWGSAFADNQWLKVDLGAVYNITGVNIVWQNSSAKSYRIECSSDNYTWAQVSRQINMPVGARTDNLQGFSASGRYIRLFAETRNSPYGFSLYSFYVYGSVLNDIVWAGTLTTSQASLLSVKKGVAYHNSDNNKSFVYNNNNWEVMSEVSVGPKGDAGIPGMQGQVGPTGPKGDAGAPGMQGSIGLTGPKGEAGAPGMQGQIGPTGPKGEAGSLLPGNAAGDMLYWDGTQWMTIPKGNEGTVLAYHNDRPSWVSSSNTTQLTDGDGNTYSSIKIGTQIWMVENFRSKTYNDGTPIPFDEWYEWTEWPTSPMCCFYKNTHDADSIKKFGALYNWYVIDPTNPKKLAPIGWHVPNDNDFTVLRDYLISSNYNYDRTSTGNKIAKSLASKYDWLTSTVLGSVGNNLLANNQSGFSAVPGGCRTYVIYQNENGYFIHIGSDLNMWSTTESDPTMDLERKNASYWFFRSTSVGLINPVMPEDKKNAYSVRLIKD